MQLFGPRELWGERPLVVMSESKALGLKVGACMLARARRWPSLALWGQGPAYRALASSPQPQALKGSRVCSRQTWPHSRARDLASEPQP